MVVTARLAWPSWRCRMWTGTPSRTSSTAWQWRSWWGAIRRRIAPHQLRHCHAVELVREGVPVHILQRQLGHANLAVTTIYLSSVAAEEVLAASHHRPPPTVAVAHLLI